MIIYVHTYISGSPAETAPLLEPTAMSTGALSTQSHIEHENSGQIYALPSTLTYICQF